jgi:hypothetical protein
LVHVFRDWSRSGDDRGGGNDVSTYEASVISLQDQPSARPEAAIAQMNRSADDRRDRNVASTRLKGKVETSDYDVFLCYNSRDEHRVKAIGERLKELGILPWLDVWEIRPGTRWQQQLQKQIKSIRAAAVFIGQRGQGPWQEMETEYLLSQLAKRKCPSSRSSSRADAAALSFRRFLPRCTWSTCGSRIPIRSSSSSGESPARGVVLRPCRRAVPA